MVSRKILFILFLCRGVQLNRDNEVMKQISIQLGIVVHYCAVKNGAPPEVVDQIRHFWDEDFNPTPELGCLLECAFKQLKIIRPSGRLSVKNGIGFLQACGADDDTAIKIGEAMGSHCTVNGTGCAAALEYAKCFRGLVLMMHMQPESFAHQG